MATSKITPFPFLQQDTGLAGPTDTDVIEPDDFPARQLMEAVNKWTSAECVDCAALFTNQSEAFEHERIFPASHSPPQWAS